MSTFLRRSGLGLGLMLLTAGTLAQAQGAAAGNAAEQRIDNRQQRQEDRVNQGIKSGELTKPEARRLQRQQAGIARAEGRAEADGKLTKAEAARIEKRQDRASGRIYRQKHDRQSRPG